MIVDSRDGRLDREMDALTDDLTAPAQIGYFRQYGNGKSLWDLDRLHEFIDLLRSFDLVHPSVFNFNYPSSQRKTNNQDQQFAYFRFLSAPGGPVEIFEDALKKQHRLEAFGPHEDISIIESSLVLLNNYERDKHLMELEDIIRIIDQLERLELFPAENFDFKSNALERKDLMETKLQNLMYYLETTVGLIEKDLRLDWGHALNKAVTNSSFDNILSNTQSKSGELLSSQ